jgi:DNA-binding NtrC family response regulator
LVSNSSEESVLAALRAGVADYLKYPFALDELILRVNLVIASKSVASPEPDTFASAGPLVGGHQMVGSSPSVRKIKDYIGKVAETSSNVLITGETGTGKELVAELIHRNSSRRDRPFICVNCAAMPESLIESELFGHQRGAFTGADVTVEGKLKSAHRGTVFFDEIGDMSLVAQAKVLRVIESKMVTPLGSHSSAPSDFRVIAATNRNLESMVQGGDFRRDLYFRLNVVRFHMPPLRERKDDIVELLNHHIGELNRASGYTVEGFTRQALEAMLNYHWPGNVRELRNVVEAVFVTCRRGRISPSDVPSHFWHQISKSGKTLSEADVLLGALFQTNWNVSRAAEMLHWSRMTIYRKMEKYAISKLRSCHPSLVTGGRATRVGNRYLENQGGGDRDDCRAARS